MAEAHPGCRDRHLNQRSVVARPTLRQDDERTLGIGPALRPIIPDQAASPTLHAAPSPGAAPGPSSLGMGVFPPETFG